MIIRTIIDPVSLREVRDSESQPSVHDGDGALGVCTLWCLMKSKVITNDRRAACY